MNKAERKDIITIDVGEINTSDELQELLKKKLNFPAFYGKNWHAFWDTITGLVELPEKVLILRFDILKNRLPQDAEFLKYYSDKYNNFANRLKKIEY